MKLTKRLAGLSAYARAEDHLLQQTYSGAIVTVAGCCLALILFMHELQFYMTPYTTTEMGVDKTRREKLRVSLNITFPALPCQALSLDAVDATGKRETDVIQGGDVTIHKYRLDRYGQHIDSTEYVPPAIVQVVDTPQGLRLSGQAREDQAVIERAYNEHEGCMMFGHLDVMRVSGNFHISVQTDSFLNMKQTQTEIMKAIRRFQASMEAGQVPQSNVLQVMHDTAYINVSHIVNEMRFGPEFPGRINPLDGFQRIVDHDSGIFKYYLKLVPTDYQFRNGLSMKTNQYSVNEYFHGINHNEGVLPAVFFMYDLSPITVTIREQTRSLAHFLVQLCAVVGGAFAVTGMVDRWVYWLVNNVAPGHA